MPYMTVLPAYGTDYKSAKAAALAWENGDDFQDARTLQYLSKRDLENEGPDLHVQVRYNKLTRIVNVR